jgi:ubiquinone/menaquinone biosynthesis C-methylase UbiE
MKRYRAIAEYYDAENARHAMLEQDVPFFLGQLPKSRPQSILELAAGTARAAIPMAQAGHRVVGVDYADDMLAIARRKLDAVGLSERELSIVPGDILTLNLRRRFDWVCIFFNTFLGFTSLEDQDRALTAVKRHLKPAGRLWLDIFNPDPGLLARDVITGLDPCVFHVPRYDRTVFMTTEVRRDKRPQVQRITFRYRWFDRHGVERGRRVEFELTYLFPRELRLLLERNGLRIERLWGDYDGSDVTPRSPRLIARCCRL